MEILTNTEHEKQEFKITAMITNCDGYDGCRLMGVSSCGDCPVFEPKGGKK